jgi:two-component system, NtrC family, response regulator HydG
VRIDCSLSTEMNFREGLLGQNGEGGAWVKQARNGTLFLQHLQCLSASVQKELVSVLRNTAHGFRLICTTSEDLEQMVDEGKFHDELFYRVASLPMHMPALRERLEDIPLLVKHYTAQAANPQFEANQIEFTPDAIALMTAYHWPGNLIELYQVVSKIAATTETRVITSQQLPLRLRELKHWPTLAEYLAGQEKQYIDMVLHASRDDRAAAAKVLGIDPGKLGE